MTYITCLVNNNTVDNVARKEPAEDTDNSVGVEKQDERPSGEQTILYPHEVKHHLRKLWNNEKNVLRHIFRAFNVNAGSMEYPVDVFFKQVQPVMPTRYRPVSTKCTKFCITFYLLMIY